MEILNDFNTSVCKALEEIDPKWQSYQGLVVCGTHAPHDTEMIIEKIRQARAMGLPALLICAGHQLGAIQWARDNGIPDATSEEYGHVGTCVVRKRPQLKVGLHEGESWWSNYEVVIEVYEKYMKFLPVHFSSVAFHPEYGSCIGVPHPLLVRFLNNCRKYGK